MRAAPLSLTSVVIKRQVQACLTLQQKLLPIQGHVWKGAQGNAWPARALETRDDRALLKKWGPTLLKWDQLPAVANHRRVYQATCLCGSRFYYLAEDLCARARHGFGCLSRHCRSSPTCCWLWSNWDFCLWVQYGQLIAHQWADLDPSWGGLEAAPAALKRGWELFRADVLRALPTYKEWPHTTPWVSKQIETLPLSYANMSFVAEPDNHFFKLDKLYVAEDWFFFPVYFLLSHSDSSEDWLSLATRSFIQHVEVTQNDKGQ